MDCVPSTEPIAWWVLEAVAVAGLLVAEGRGFRQAIILSKMTASSTFLAYAMALGAFDTATGSLLFSGLALCWLGDALLLPPGQTIWFQLGIGSFLLGHVAYAATFLGLGFHFPTLTVAAAIISSASWIVLGWLRPKVPADLSVAVQSYVVVIGTMVACSLSAFAAGAPCAVATGAMLFATSDLSVARERFVSQSFLNSAWGLPAYFAAQMILAGSIPAMTSGS